MNCELQDTEYKLQDINYKSQVTNYQLQVTNSDRVVGTYISIVQTHRRGHEFFLKRAIAVLVARRIYA